MLKPGPKPKPWLKASLDYLGESPLIFKACQTCFYNLELEQEDIFSDDDTIDLFYREKVRIAHTYGFCVICFSDEFNK
jgi:hypothetical protein